MRTTTVALLLFALVCLPAGAAQARVFIHLRALARRGVAVSAEAVLLGPYRPLDALDAGRRLVPASLTKLYTTAAALQRWGPKHRFVTRLVTTGALSNGVLQGNLILQGDGDPGLDAGDLWQLAQSLNNHGVRRVSGQLIVDESRFGPVKCISEDRCHAETHTEHAYNALLSAAGVDYGNWCVAVMPAQQVGRAALVAPCHGQRGVVHIDSRVKTVSAARSPSISASRTTDAGGDIIHLRGDIPAGGSQQRIYLAASDPARQTARLLLHILQGSGVKVSRGFRISRKPVSASARTLSQVKSPTLQAMLERMLTYSNNYMADTLALDLAHRRVPIQASLRDGGRVLERFAARLRLPDGRDPARPVFLSGSGLTVQNRVSAQDLIALLRALYHRPALFPAFVGALSVPQSSPMHMLKGGDSRWLRQVMVKTGSLNDPVSVLGVAGYFRTRDGRWGAFAAITNGTARRPHVAWFKAMRAIEDDVARLVALR